MVKTSSLEKDMPMKRFAPLLLILLVGCAGNLETKAITSFAIACDSYVSTMKVLTGLNKRSKLSLAEMYTVEKNRRIISPICKTKDPTDPITLLNSIESGIIELITIKEKNIGNS